MSPSGHEADTSAEKLAHAALSVCLHSEFSHQLQAASMQLKTVTRV